MLAAGGLGAAVTCPMRRARPTLAWSMWRQVRRQSAENPISTVDADAISD